MGRIAILIILLFVSCNKSKNDDVKITKTVSLQKTQSDVSCSELFRIGEYPENDWWEDFQDDHLSCIITKAFEKNPSLLAAKERVSTANEQALEVRSQLFPQISGLFQYAWLYLADTHFLQSLIPNLQNSEYLYNLMFNFNYEFDLFGKYKKQYESALGEKHASRLAFEQAKNILSASIAKSYFTLSAMKAKKEVVIQMFHNKERLLSLVRLRKKNKISSKVEENTVNEALKACEQILIAINAEIKLEQSLINILAGRDPEEEVKTAPCYEVFNKKLEFPQKITSTLLTRRPDLLASLWIAKKNALNIGVAVRNFLPTVSIMDGPGFATGRGGNVFSSKSFNNLLVPELKQPIFQGGRIYYNWKKSISIYKDSVYQFNQQFLEAAKQVFDAVVNYQKIAEVLSLQDEKLSLAKLNYELETLKYSAGIVSLIEVLDYDDIYLQNKCNMIEKENQKFHYYIEFIQSLGGGFKETKELPFE